MNPIDNAIVLDEAKRYTDSKQLAKVVVEKKQLISYSDLPLDYDNEEGYVSCGFSPAPFIPYSGKTYEVVWNGDTYKANCKDVSEAVGFPIALIIGNTAMTGGDDTGEPFALVYMDDGEENGLEVFAVGATADVFIDLTVSEFTETIHPIDQKFLPGVCLPVVELSTEIPLSDGTAPTKLTTGESEQINKATANGLPFVLKLPGELSILMNKANYFYTGVYHLDVMVTVMLVSDGSGGWSAGMTAAKVSG